MEEKWAKFQELHQGEIDKQKIRLSKIAEKSNNLRKTYAVEKGKMEEEEKTKTERIQGFRAKIRENLISENGFKSILNELDLNTKK